MSDNDALLAVKDLKVAFPVHGGVLRHKVAEVKAVDGVSFEVREGETLGLVGESGSGKTTIGRAVVNLLRALSPDVKLSGEIMFRTNGTAVQLNGLDRRAMLPYRSQIQMIFQDPYSSLNPRMTVRDTIDRSLRLHTTLDRRQRQRRVDEVLDRVGLQAEAAGRYPHEFSGGQRQRVGIARALATRPKLIIADEPVSALDVSVQAQVINLMEELQEEYGLTYVFIAHDLSVVYHISNTIAVMYLGHFVEIGTAQSIYKSPQHPYSRALLSAVPRPDPHGDPMRRVRLEGDIPTPIAKPPGCPFHSRCPIVRDDCRVTVPQYETIGDARVACPYAREFDTLRSG